mmetsp:Transcript_27619/g.43116  ORF Transcript_27619/g.43116 Transcript_27619/m.43116 type:complete len:262 (+) Transcript_27619:68-853(+)
MLRMRLLSSLILLALSSSGAQAFTSPLSSSALISSRSAPDHMLSATLACRTRRSGRAGGLRGLRAEESGFAGFFAKISGSKPSAPETLSSATPQALDKPQPQPPRLGTRRLPETKGTVMKSFGLGTSKLGGTRKVTVKPPAHQPRELQVKSASLSIAGRDHGTGKQNQDLFFSRKGQGPNKSAVTLVGLDGHGVHGGAVAQQIAHSLTNTFKAEVLSSAQPPAFKTDKHHNPRHSTPNSKPQTSDPTANPHLKLQTLNVNF